MSHFSLTGWYFTSKHGDVMAWKCFTHGPLARYVKLRVRMRRECRERFLRHRRWAIPTCITARASHTCRDACRDRQLSVSFEIGGGGKRSRHSRRMRNLQIYVSGKRPITSPHEGNPSVAEGFPLHLMQSAIYVDLWCLLCGPQQIVEQAVKLWVVSDTIIDTL